MKTIFTFFISIISLVANAQFEQPFEWNADHSGQTDTLMVSVKVPVGHYLYADQTKLVVESEGQKLKAEKIPTKIPHTDEFGTHEIYQEGKAYTWIYAIKSGSPYVVKIDFQGCKDKTEKHKYII